MKAAPLILAVDRNRRNLELMEKFLSEAGYRTIKAEKAEDFDHILAQKLLPDLALVDIAGFDRSIWDFCENLKENDIPFLVISPHQADAIQTQSITHGARGVLSKPLGVRKLMAIIQSLLEHPR